MDYTELSADELTLEIQRTYDSIRSIDHDQNIPERKRDHMVLDLRHDLRRLLEARSIVAKNLYKQAILKR